MHSKSMLPLSSRRRSLRSAAARLPDRKQEDAASKQADASTGTRARAERAVQPGARTSTRPATSTSAARRSTRRCSSTPRTRPLRVLRPSSPSSRASSTSPTRSWTIARKLDPKDAEADYLSGVVYQRWQKPQAALRVLHRRRREGTRRSWPTCWRRRRCWSRWTAPTRRWRCSRSKVVYFEHSAVIRDAVGQLLMQQGKYHEAVDDAPPGEHPRDRRPARSASTWRWRCSTTSSTARRSTSLAQAGARTRSTPSAPTCWLALGECQLQTRQAARRAATASRPPRSSSRRIAGVARPGQGGAGARTTCSAPSCRCARRIALDAEPARGAPAARLPPPAPGQAARRAGRRSSKASALDRKDTVSLCMVGYVLREARPPRRGDAVLRQGAEDQAGRRAGDAS